VEDPSLALAREHVHGPGKAVVSGGLARLERIENDRSAEKNPGIDGIEVTDDLADVLDPAIGALDARDVVEVIDRAGYLEIHRESDGIRLARAGHQTAENLRIDQMVAHAQQERTVQKGPGLEHRDAVGALPLFIDDVHDRDSFPCGKYVQRGS